jgi:hypothetical protein
VGIGDTERLIGDLLCRSPVQWRGGDDADAIAAFLAAGRRHGVLPLLDAEFRRRSDIETWPQEILDACRVAALSGAMLELARRAENRKVIDALVAAEAAPLLLKGAALAYTHYPNPALRPRCDTDLLILPHRRAAAAAALAALGYAREAGVEGEFVSYQATWSREAGNGIEHSLDVHWRINNSQMLARVLTYAELAARALALPPLGPNARALADVDALLLACLHRAGHANAPYYAGDVAHSGDRAIWLYDIHLLFARMSGEEQDDFAARAVAKRIRTICADALRCSAEWFGTPIPRRVADVLHAPGPAEPSARYLSGGRARQMIGDFLALDRWGDRAGWVRELAFPSADYMRTKYPDAAGTWLPILYARRGLASVSRVVFPRGAGHGH